jgi:hypothetical protein
LSFVAGSLVGEDDELDVIATFWVILRMQQLKMLLVPTYWLAFIDGRSILAPTIQVHLRQHKILHALVGILKNKGKSLHDKMDVLIGVIDFLPVKEWAC